MIVNPGFSFTTLSGKCSIVPTSETNLPTWGPQYFEAVVFKTNGELITVYDKGPGYGSNDDSIALLFASIDISKKNELLDFCNKNGFPVSHAPLANFRNDYLFFDLEKDDYMKHSKLLNKDDRTWLFIIQRDIVQMQKCIQLQQNIQEQDLVSIFKIILYFCFDLYGLDFENSKLETETFQFNHHFFRYVEKRGFTKKDRKLPMPISELISYFLSDIEQNRTLVDSAALSGIAIPDIYVLSSFPFWKSLILVLNLILDNYEIDEIDVYGNVQLSPNNSISTSNFSDDQIDLFLKVAKGVLSDIFKEHLHSVYPEVTFNRDGSLESSWRIPSLLSAMYLELFFRISPNSQARKCENPDCTRFYIRTSSKPTKKYCSNACALLMAKRKQRERERKLK